MFTGTVQTATAVRTYQVVPQAADGKTIVARVSATEGPVDVTDLSGMPVYLETRVVAKGSLPVNDKGEEKKVSQGGGWHIVFRARACSQRHSTGVKLLP